MNRDAPVAIVGAGIAGLTAALCFARRGIDVHVIEQTAALSETGAGLQLSPNATRILDHLDLLPSLQSVWSEPHSIDLMDGTSLRRIASVPSGPFARERWKAPYGVLRRADLQAVLMEAVAVETRCRLHLGAKLERVSPDALETSIGVRPHLIVGADGVWSATRNSVQGSGDARFSGNIACRLTLREADAPAIFDRTRVMAFLGGGAHMVVYPLPSSGSFNVVAITAARNPGEAWNARTAPSSVSNDLLRALDSWSPQLRSVFSDRAISGIWPLHAVSDGAWHRGEDIVLIGDAAHAMMPFAAQGAAMAIEDAFELAAFVTAGRPLADFVDHRKKRIARVRARGAFNRFAYHARGPVRIGRDLVLSVRSPERLAADFDWLYGYQPRD